MNEDSVRGWWLQGVTGPLEAADETKGNSNQQITVTGERQRKKKLREQNYLLISKVDMSFIYAGIMWHSCKTSETAMKTCKKQSSLCPRAMQPGCLLYMCKHIYIYIEEKLLDQHFEFDIFKTVNLLT